VVESASGTVTVNPGQWMAAQWAGTEGRQMRRQVSFRVVSGILTVTVNGEQFEFEASESVQTLTFVNSLALNELMFACSDNALAEVLSASRIMGTVVSIR
jgi:gentisate 1,2-dioxygenase